MDDNYTESGKQVGFTEEQLNWLAETFKFDEEDDD